MRRSQTIPSRPDKKESILIFAAVTKKAEEETGADVADRNYEIAWDQTGTLAEKMAIPAHTMAGARAKVIAAIQCGGSYWDKPFADLDWGDKGVRHHKKWKPPLRA